MKRSSGLSITTGRVCGIDVAAIAPDEAVQLVVEAAALRRTLQVHLCNAFTLSLVEQDSELRAALECADLNLPDGAPVAWLLRSHGVRGPVRGPALMPNVVRAGAPLGLRHYLWGGGPGVAEEVAARLVEVDPSVVVVGCEAPPYTDLRDEEVAALAARVEANRANILWVGLGTPRQDYLIPRIASYVSCAIVPVGAAFDFLAGRVPEAPQRLRGSGLEWLYRFAREPRRLWSRYLVGNPRFVRMVVVDILARRREIPESQS